MQTYLADLPVDSLRIPRSVAGDGGVAGVASPDWTSGFFAGTLWQLAAADEGTATSRALERAARTWTAFSTKEQYNAGDHDLGFRVYCSFGEGYDLFGVDAYRPVIVQAARSLATRFDERVGAIRSWDWNRDQWQYPVIVDNMMNLELLFEAARLSGDTSLYRVADRHARTTLANHFRADHSSYHVVDYDTLTGAVRLKQTHQGMADESAWARGQAWGLYGFTAAYRYTRDPAYLAQAERIAEFFFTHPNLPADGIPYFDFDAPAGKTTPRDASAAVIAASALLELLEYVPAKRERYLGWADRVLATLETEAYQARTPPFLLGHSTGNQPAGSEIDVPINYADYYYVEALGRR